MCLLGCEGSDGMNDHRVRAMRLEGKYTLQLRSNCGRNVGSGPSVESFHKKGSRTQVNRRCILIDMTLEAPVCHSDLGYHHPFQRFMIQVEGWGG